MVPFAGYEMPIQYPDKEVGGGIMQEHLHTRQAASIFDVSHMGQVMLIGAGAGQYLESLTPGNITGLKPHRMRYSVLLNDNGGIIDDLMITNRPMLEKDGSYTEAFFLVLNASRIAEDKAAIKANLPDGIVLKCLPQEALIAVQGPSAVAAVATLLPEISTLKFMQGMEARYQGLAIYVTRSGYTGEDGVEVSIPSRAVAAFVQQLRSIPGVKMAGLGARDTLRLEAGLCLYGNDIDDTTSPIEADLAWVIGKNRIANDFPGAAFIRQQQEGGAGRYRLAFTVEGKQPVRAGAKIFAGMEDVGIISSGGFSPTLQKPIAMGYVTQQTGPFEAEVRGKRIQLHIAKTPFVPTNYHK